MITGNKLKYYSSLLNKKQREKENKFIVEGERSVLEGIASDYHCEAVLISNEFSEKKSSLVDLIKRKKTDLFLLKQKEFLKISDTKSPQGIAAIFHKPKLDADDLSSFDDVIVMLDNISDPGNLGTIIRNCDWFGVKNILLSNNTADYTNPKVIRSSMGSVFHVNLFEGINSEILLNIKERGYEIICADTEGENIFTYQCDKKIILILSSEAHGPSEEVEKASDKKICIPRIGSAESLNVASAAAVILAELTK